MVTKEQQDKFETIIGQGDHDIGGYRTNQIGMWFELSALARVFNEVQEQDLEITDLEKSQFEGDIYMRLR